MRVLISTAGSHGDTLPFIALGKEFATRGHEVIFYSNPFFRPYVADAAIPFVPIGTVDEYLSLFGELADQDPNKAFKRVAKEYARIGPEFYRAMKRDVIAGQTISIGNSLLFAHRLLRETGGVPAATVHLAPAVFRSNHKPARLVPRWIDSRTPTLLKRSAWWLADRLVYDPLFTTPLNAFRSEIGLPRVDRIFRSWIHDADCVLGMFPEWFGEPQSDWPEKLVLTNFPFYDHGESAPLSPELDAFLRAGPPPVAFSAGTATATAHRFFETSVAAAKLAGLRAVLLTHFADQVPDSLPQGMIHADYAPFGALLPRLAAFVHHGGIGSTSQALRAGVPQLIRPVAYDQFDNAARAVRLGVAHELLPRKYAPRAVADALLAITANPLVRQRCQAVATRVADCSSISAACSAILSRLHQVVPEPAA